MSVKRHVGEGWIGGSWVRGRKGWEGVRPQSSRLTLLLTLTCCHRHLLNVILFVLLFLLIEFFFRLAWNGTCLCLQLSLLQRTSVQFGTYLILHVVVYFLKLFSIRINLWEMLLYICILRTKKFHRTISLVCIIL